ncbi:hypothetical protein LTR66_016065, partial [Elasticomyces elasticus]
PTSFLKSSHHRDRVHYLDKLSDYLDLRQHHFGHLDLVNHVHYLDCHLLPEMW